MRISIGLLLLVFATPVRAAPVRLPVTADTTICLHPDELDMTAGGARRLKLKGRENLILLDFDTGPIGGRKVLRATLTLHDADGTPARLRRVGWSTVASGWSEGRGDFTVAPGAGRDGPGTGRGARWTDAGGDVFAASFGRAGTLHGRVEARPGRDGVWTIELDPRIIDARVAQLSAGLLLADDSGQSRLNNWFDARESGRGPELTVELGDVLDRSRDPDPGPLSVVVAPRPELATEGHGAAEVSWDGPADGAEAAALLGYVVRAGSGDVSIRPLPRWMHPAVPPVGERPKMLFTSLNPDASLTVDVIAVGRDGIPLRYGRVAGFASGAPHAAAAPLATAPGAPAAGEPAHGGPLTIWAVPDGCRVNPVGGNALEDPAADYRGTPAGAWRRANPAWSGKDRVIRLSGLRGEWVAASLIVEAAVPGQEFAVRPGPLTGPRGARIPAAVVQLSRIAYVKPATDTAWYADPLLPLAPGEPCAIPAQAHAPANQRNQAVYLELRIPDAASPGRYAGTIAVTAAGAKPIPIGLTVEVASGQMPAAAHFVYSLNTYGSEQFGIHERDWYALAHAHRATLAVLHYSHSGNQDPGTAPAVSGTGNAARIADWSAWDRRFGPLFDGSAFTDDGRPGVGVDHFYLPLCESYPIRMEQGYRWNALSLDEHVWQAGLIEEGFDANWRQTWVAVAKDWLAHIKSKSWNTSFQAFCNDKYEYKMKDAKTGIPGKGVSFWELDEPRDPDDFRALAFFGGMVRDAQNGDRSHLVFRADVSCPQWGRDLLDRIMDLQVSGAWPQQQQLLSDQRRDFGQTLWTYGTPPPVTESSTKPSADALALWLAGVDGWVPWQTVGTAAAWTTAEDTALMLPGDPAGLKGPAPTLRLKAYRRAEQDVEYAWLWAKKTGLLDADFTRRRIAARLLPLLRDPGTAGESLPSSGPVSSRLDLFRNSLRKEL